jgi:LacI family transcriptional regulator
MKKKVRLALVLPLDQEYFRRVAFGVLQFAGGRQWVIQTFAESDYPTAADWKPCGIIGALTVVRPLAQWRAMDVPYVDVSGEGPTDLPRVTSDDAEIGTLAAAHLIDRGFRHFAYAGPTRFDGIDAREKGFRDRLLITGTQNISVHRDPGELRQWLASLPRGTGVLARNDLLGRQIIGACAEAGLRVPEDIAVLGCGNDELICRMARPTLSSVSLPAERVGFAAASMLDHMVDNQTIPRQQVAMPVSSVVSRQSTDVISIADAQVAAAMRFIRAHAGEWIGVREMLLAVGVNRRSLERKFRQVIGRSPLEEIRRVRLEIAKDLLSRTDLVMPIVARRAGFSEAKQLSLTFHNELQMTPTAYRRKFRVPTEPQVEEPETAE